MSSTHELDNNLQEIKKLTRIVLPDDDLYLFRLGIALYGFASINSFMCEVIAHLDKNRNHTELQDMESGRILSTFRGVLESLKSNNKFIEIQEIMQKAADTFDILNQVRNDIMHSYPITNPGGEQILHRRRDCNNKYFEITNEFLESFISQLQDVSAGLYKIREGVWSKKET